MNGLSKGSATWTEIDDAAHDQRIDNYLLKTLKGVPKSHVYRILRSGQVRVNSRRVDADYRLRQGDRVRIPPVRVATPGTNRRPPAGPVAQTLFEDEWLLAIDKPSGLAVHGGSGVSFGAIEALRAARPEARFLELVHRLDRDTSGVLLLAKKRPALVAMHAQLREGRVDKRYLVLVAGNWSEARRKVVLPLHKFVNRSGERRVVVDEQEGAAAHTVFRLVRHLAGYTLLEAELKTGRTHQIRVHLSHLGFPIAGDDKYGDFEANRALAKTGLKRMFLHAASMRFSHPAGGERVRIEAPLPPELERFLADLARNPVQSA
ncbi:MAG TPA: RluA family pseudouridine synthase [Burkholderiales bacterium]|nr:RluA family pseudouridine synthase [Burkholderiales bacterium]